MAILDKGKKFTAVSITIPSKDREGCELGGIREHMLRFAQSSFIEFFGGYTTTEGMGGWYSERYGAEMQERVSIVTAYSTGEVGYVVVQRLAERIKAELEQDSVMFTIGDQLHFA